MDKFIEAIANGDFSAILGLVTTLLSGGFGAALVVLASKFLKYKKSVEDIVNKTNDKLIPEFKEIAKETVENVVEPLRADLKVLAESIALASTNDPNNKIALINNVSKIGISKEVKEVVIEKVEEEVKEKEELNEAIDEAIKNLEENKIETL